MFKCEKCNKESNPREKSEVQYKFRDKTYENFRIVFDPDTKRKKREHFKTEGKEPISQTQVCKECYVN